MKSEMQNTNFTHAKCTNCGHLGKIESFPQRRVNEQKSKGDDGSTFEVYQLVLTCPICTTDNCEALFPNEVN